MNIKEAIRTVSFKKKKLEKNQLYTIWGEELQKKMIEAKDSEKKEPFVLPEYPRPQLVREHYRILNGWWRYAIEEGDGQPEWQGDILVPFSPESVLSGVGRQLLPGQSLWYERMIELTEEERQQAKVCKKRLLLHFGAVDQSCQVWWNGGFLGTHRGGYLPFTFDVTPYLQEKNCLRLQVKDESDASYHARGKQTLSPGGMFYTAQSGIWQTVWMEWVPETYIERIHLIPDFDRRSVQAELVLCSLKEGESRRKKIRLERHLKEQEFHPWTPEDPYLYEWEITEGEDTVRTYFAMRIFTTEPDEEGMLRLCLNHKPYYQHGILDQGYWPDGLMTAPSDEAMVYDIKAMKQAGFCMIRKHIKIEPLRWYYHCDRLGMLVWQDMVNGGGKYDPVRLTYLPTAFSWLQSHMNDRKYHIFARESLEGRKEWLAECRETIKLLWNSPSICLWVPFNEGWGQFEAIQVEKMIRKLDDSRWIDHASGWVDQGVGDVKSIHNYFQRLHIRPEKKRPDKVGRKKKTDSPPSEYGRPVVYSEYGGYACYVPGHSYSNQVYGYRHYETMPKLQEAYWKLQERMRLMRRDGLCADVYTQLSDVEDEVNGLLTYDRKIYKLDRLVRGQNASEQRKKRYDNLLYYDGNAD